MGRSQKEEYDSSNKTKATLQINLQVAVKKENSDIHIINEPSVYKIENPPVFVVETGETPSRDETRGE